MEAKTTHVSTYISHRVITACPSNAETIHVCVALHAFKNLFQGWDGNVLPRSKTVIII